MSPSPTLSFVSLDDTEAAMLLSRYSIGLTPEEARTVEKMVGRPLTLTEAVIWGIQGSEHCSYKSSRRFLAAFPTKNRHVILGPKEDAGIVAITDGPKGKRWGIVIGHESHNHPSQIVPFEGAATGIGGCVRDVLCMGARVIGCMDSLRLGDLSTDESKSIAKEVVRGIAGYGNPLGIPNLGGDTVFDATYNKNCLVNAICMGIVREDQIIHSFVPDEAGTVGYDIVLIGKATDRSGFGGASFASATMEEEKREQNTGAVQEPNPFLERHLLAATYDLFDWLARENHLHQVSFKDLGAGGVVCAAVEQVSEQGMGAVIDLEEVHVSIPDLPPAVIACAETQERFCWMCHPDLTETIVSHYNKEWDLPSVAQGACARVIGKVTKSDRFILQYKGERVCDVLSSHITSGLSYTRPTQEKKRVYAEPQIACEKDTIAVNGHRFTIREIFRMMLQHPNHASKQPVFLHYDKNVIGNTVLEPGEADAGVVAPLTDLQSYVHRGERKDWKIGEKESMVGVAFSAGGNGRYGKISAYLQGLNAAVETMRNVICVGALPRALTDCLNYGNPEDPMQLKDLEDGVHGITDAASGIVIGGEPVAIISGNVSLYNTTPDKGAINPTAIVSCVGIMEDHTQAVTMQLKKPASKLYLIGTPKNECGASAYHQILEQLTNAKPDALLGNNPPSPDLAETLKQFLAVHSLIAQGHVLACHDVSEGGLILALFEMMLPQRKKGGTLGLSINLSSIAPSLRNDTVLFSETGCILCEIHGDHADACRSILTKNSVEFHEIGGTNESAILHIERNGAVLMDASLRELMPVWETGLSGAWQ